MNHLRDSNCKAVHGDTAGLPTCDLLLFIVIVAGSQEVAEDESRNIHLLLFMFHDRDPLPVVPYGNCI